MKTKFKKFIALGLCALMIFSSCAKKTGSGGDDNSGKEVTSEGLKAEIVVQVEKDWMDYYKKAVDKVLEKNPDSKIELKEIGSFDHLDILKVPMQLTLTLRTCLHFLLTDLLTL